MISLINDRDEIVFAGFDTLDTAREQAGEWRKSTGEYLMVLAPCEQCGHDSLLTPGKPALCWHCETEEHRHG